MASLLPADFDRACFERLLGFYATSNTIVRNSEALTNNEGKKRITNPHGPRAFANTIPVSDSEKAAEAMMQQWGELPTVIDPMSGGGSIPLEAARLGVHTLANELNPVACSVLEATIDYPFRFGASLVQKARPWAVKWREKFCERMEVFYRVDSIVPAYTYIFARTVPCPDTGHPTPLVPDWSLLRGSGSTHVVAEPVGIDKMTGAWTIRVREVGKGANQLRQAPQPTYGRGQGLSLFTGAVIADDYIKAMAHQGKLGSVLYAVATKATTKLEFRPAREADRQALQDAERELARLRPQWEEGNIIPTELFPSICSDERPRIYGSSAKTPKQAFASPKKLRQTQCRLV